MTTENARFRRGSAVFTCRSCKHQTRFVGDRTAADLELCRPCYDEAGIENEHADGYHAKEKSADCHQCFPGKVLTVKQQRELTAKQALTPAADIKKEVPVAQKTETVASLIKKLQALKDKSDSEGRKLRRALRALGHKGGVRIPKPAAKKPAAPTKPAKPAPAKKAAAPAKDPGTSAVSSLLKLGPTK